MTDEERVEEMEEADRKLAELIERFSRKAPLLWPVRPTPSADRRNVERVREL